MSKDRSSLSTDHELSPRAIFATMTGAMIAMLMASLDQTIVGTAMPRIISELHGFEHYSGVITAYLIASTAAVPIVGKLSDIYGRRFFLLFGVIWFVLASALCGLSQSMIQLVAFRGLQGIGAGIIQTMVWAIVADLYPPAQRGRVMGIMGAVFGLSSVVGPLIGGFLTDGPGWRYAFYVNLPIGFFAVLILFYFFPHVKPEKVEGFRIDYFGSLTLVAGIVPFLLALSWGGRDYAWTSHLILGLVAAGLVFSALFFRIETQASHPILPLHLFRNPIFSISVASAALIAAGMFGASLFIPLFVQSVLGTSATESGKILMPMTLSILLSAVISGQLITRSGRYKPFAILGVTTSAIGVFLLSRMDESTSYMTVVRDVLILGIGLGASMPVFSLSVQNAVERRFVGTATSTLQFMRSIGGSLGVALFGSILINQFVPAFHRAISPGILSALSPAQLSSLDNPQSYMRTEAAKRMDVLFPGFGDNGKQLLDSIRHAARTGLTTALSDVFLIAAGLLLVATVLTLFLRELPLRKTNRQ
jgi:EmrB/QacA subfamily drug resistance transporter